MEQLEEGDRSLRHWDQAIGIWKKIGRRSALQAAFEGRGRMEMYENSLDAAKDLFRESLQLAQELTAVDAVAHVKHLLGRVHMKAGGFPQAQTLFNESLPAARRFRLEALVRLNEVYLSGVKAHTGQVQEGIRELEALLARWENDSAPKAGLLQVELLLGKAYKLARRVGPTNKHYVRALQLARELHLPLYVREITREMKDSF